MVFYKANEKNTCDCVSYDTNYQRQNVAFLLQLPAELPKITVLVAKQKF